jgi:hypothetical protein
MDVHTALLDVFGAVAVGLVDVDGQPTGLARSEGTIDTYAPPGVEVNCDDAHRLPSS